MALYLEKHIRNAHKFTDDVERKIVGISSKNQENIMDWNFLHGFIAYTCWLYYE